MGVAVSMRPERRGASRLRRAVWGLLAVAIALGMWHWGTGDVRSLTPASVSTAQALPPAWRDAGQAAGAPTVFQTGLEALPRSVQGTEVDGAVTADAQGRLQVTRELRNLFDYFLSVVGEEPLSRIRERVAAYLSARLKASATQAGLDLFDRYVAFTQARGQMAQGPDDGAPTLSLTQIAERHQQVAALRTRHFSGAEIEAFFGDETREDSFQLQRASILQDAKLSAVDKARRLQTLITALPATLRDRLTPLDTVRDLQALTQDWRARGGTAAELHAARVELVGPQATERLEALDAQRQGWQQRVQAWRQHRSALQADASLSAVQREQALTQWTQSQFTATERLRLNAMDEPTAPSP